MYDVHPVDALKRSYPKRRWRCSVAGQGNRIRWCSCVAVTCGGARHSKLGGRRRGRGTESIWCRQACLDHDEWDGGEVAGRSKLGAQMCRRDLLHLGNVNTWESTLGLPLTLLPG